MVDKHVKHNHHVEHEHTMFGELLCHFPYAVFSVAFGLVVLSFLAYASLVSGATECVIRRGSNILFHSFHFMHIVFASTGTMITFFRFSKNVVKGFLVGTLCSVVFCTLSDAILPHLAGKILGIKMSFHLCFMSELHNILPFLFVGLLNGFIMSKHHSAKQNILSVFSHFIHILISSFASIFYLVAGGFTDWYTSIGFVFLFLIIAVVVPCTFSDLVVPMAFARGGKDHAKH